MQMSHEESSPRSADQIREQLADLSILKGKATILDGSDFAARAAMLSIQRQELELRKELNAALARLQARSAEPIGGGERRGFQARSWVELWMRPLLAGLVLLVALIGWLAGAEYSNVLLAVLASGLALLDVSTFAWLKWKRRGRASDQP
jgi:hypothetical protein